MQQSNHRGERTQGKGHDKRKAVEQQRAKAPLPSPPPPPPALAARLRLHPFPSPLSPPPPPSSRRAPCRAARPSAGETVSRRGRARRRAQSARTRRAIAIDDMLADASPDRAARAQDRPRGDRARKAPSGCLESAPRARRGRKRRGEAERGGEREGRRARKGGARRAFRVALGSAASDLDARTAATAIATLERAPPPGQRAALRAHARGLRRAPRARGTSRHTAGGSRPPRNAGRDPGGRAAWRGSPPPAPGPWPLAPSPPPLPPPRAPAFARFDRASRGASGRRKPIRNAERPAGSAPKFDAAQRGRIADRPAGGAAGRQRARARVASPRPLPTRGWSARGERARSGGAEGEEGHSRGGWRRAAAGGSANSSRPRVGGRDRGFSGLSAHEGARRARLTRIARSRARRPNCVRGRAPTRDPPRARWETPARAPRPRLRHPSPPSAPAAPRRSRSASRRASPRADRTSRTGAADSHRHLWPKIVVCVR